MRILGSAETIAPKPAESRSVWIAGELQDIPVHQRDALALNTCLTGPALIEQADTTIFIDPGLQATTDPCGNLVITRTGEAA